MFDSPINYSEQIQSIEGELNLKALHISICVAAIG